MYARRLARRFDPDMRLVAVLAGYFHDVGKAAPGFQDWMKGGPRWDFRHEVLSAVVARLAGLPDEAVLAVLSHHRGLQDDRLCDNNDLDLLSEVLGGGSGSEDSRRTKELRELLRPDFKHYLVDSACYLCTRLENEEEKRDVRCAVVRTLAKLDRREAVRAGEEVTDLHQKALDGERFPPVLEDPRPAFARGLLIAADHAASAGIPEPLDIETVAPPAFPLRAFQERCRVRGDVLLYAPTGLGKTAAAVEWVTANLRHEGERVFFVLPNKASVYAMYKALKARFGADRVAYVHGSLMLDAYARGEDLADAKLFRQVSRPIKVLTPYQLLKFFFGIKRYEVGLAEMFKGLFVFDEIHTYSADTFAMIVKMLEVLRQFEGRFIYMSATIPGYVEKILNELGSPQRVAVTPEEEEYEKFTFVRHRVRAVDADLEDVVVKEVPGLVEEGKNVLVCANRVAQAANIYRRLKEAGVHDCVLLHSRLTYGERYEREEDILRRFGEQGRAYGPRGHVLVATQVVEVSLDLNYDVGYTEVAPVDGLVQRLGRVNRRFMIDGAPVTVTRYGGRPYDKHYVDRTWKFLTEEKKGRIDLNWLATEEWLRYVFGDEMNETYRKDYENTTRLFRQVISNLKPCVEDRKNVEFGDTVDVVPESLWDRFTELWLEKRIYDALLLQAPVNKRTLSWWSREGKARKETVKGRTFWVVSSL